MEGPKWLQSGTFLNQSRMQELQSTTSPAIHAAPNSTNVSLLFSEAAMTPLRTQDDSINSLYNHA